MNMSEREAYELAEKFKYSFEIRMDTELESVCKAVPGLEFGTDDRCYFNPDKNMIHMGVGLLTGLFSPETPEDLYESLEYVLGHEIEHKRSTSTRPYAIGIRKGCEEILKYISSQVDKGVRRFRRPADYDAFASELESKGIYLSFGMIENIVSGIANSLEDGRIERIRSDRMPGYENPRTKFRGIFWEKNYTGITKVTNDMERLNVITSNILTLATCQLYEKGFAKNFFGTDVMDEVNDIMPEIARGYIASSCRAMSMEVINISKKLAPYIYSVAKLSAEDVKIRKAFEEMIKSMIEKALENGTFGLSESEEMSGELSNLPKSSFPLSDLVITLPDETYDKLMEHAKESSDGSGIRVKREHPKEEDSDKNENSSGTGSSKKSSSSDKKDGESGSGSSSKGDDGAEKEDSSKSGSSGDASDKETEDRSQNTSDKTDESKSGKKDTSSKAEIPETCSSKKGDMDKGEDADVGGNDAGENGTGKSKAVLDADKDETAKAVKEAMKQAASKTHEEAKEHVSNINVHRAHEHKASCKKEKVDKEKPVSSKEISKLIRRSFVETKREYEVKDPLPSVIAARGRAMYRKNKRYFKSLSLPNVTHLESGSIDPSRIVALGYGDTDVFRKIGKDKQFDGCAYILLDNSGSMAGNKRIEACKAAAVVEEGFRGMFPVKIAAFDETGTINHEVIKNWDEWLNKNCCWNFALHGRYGSGNEDGYDIQIAAKELLARNEKRKMLIILSDGAPGDWRLVNRAVKDARKKGIEVYSIYFEEGEVSKRGEQAMKDMYEKDYIVCSLDELDKNLYSIFKKFSRK